MYFPDATKRKLKNRKPTDHEMINFLVDKICVRYGTMTVKVVIGKKLFKRKQTEIKRNIELSTHLR